MAWAYGHCLCIEPAFQHSTIGACTSFAASFNKYTLSSPLFELKPQSFAAPGRSLRGSDPASTGTHQPPNLSRAFRSVIQPAAPCHGRVFGAADSRAAQLSPGFGSIAQSEPGRCLAVNMRSTCDETFQLKYREGLKEEAAREVDWQPDLNPRFASCNR